MVWMILFVVSIVGSIGSIMAFSATMEGMFLKTLLLCCILDVVFYVLYRKSGRYSKNKRKEQEQREIFFMTLEAEHQAGLPLAEGIKCEIIKEDDKFRILSGGNEFSLKKEKITDICVKTNVEIQNQYVSSVGGAVAGGMVFGPLGAIVGGRAKKKKITTTEYYLIFTYYSNGNVCYASFRTQDVFKAQEWEKEFKSNASVNTGVTEL